jgi:hypothetical protein
MNMLAKQNIGHVFSENPVEALSILKDNSKHQKVNISIIHLMLKENKTFLKLYNSF